jgi:hypothetical protein
MKRRKELSRVGHIRSTPLLKSTLSPSQRCLVFPFSFPTGEYWRSDRVGVSKVSGALSQMRIVLSSEQDANIRSFRGFQATELTLPIPWPAKTSRSAPVSLCQTYTLASSLPLTTKFPSMPPKQLRMTCRPCFCPVNFRARRPRLRSHR